MHLATGLTMLEITTVMLGRTTTIYPALLTSEQDAVLVDTGYPGQLPLFREALEQAGYPLETITKIIVTHQDIDHIGTLPDLLLAAPRKLDVLATEADKPYIQGERMLIKVTPEAIARFVATLPADVPEAQRLALQHRM